MVYSCVHFEPISGSTSLLHRHPHPSVANQSIDGAEPGVHIVHKTLHRLQRGKVKVDEESLTRASFLSYLFQDTISSLRVSTGEHSGGATLYNLLYNFSSKTRAGTGDNDNSTIKISRV